jgi:uncharacterized membrane protein
VRGRRDTTTPDRRTHVAARRAIGTGIVGVVAGAGAAALMPWQAALLLGWTTTAVVFLVRVWVALLPQDAGSTARHATKEDDSRVAADAGILSASLISLVAVGLLLVKGARTGGFTEGVFTGVAVLSVVISWAVVHTIFALRYGHIYYGGDGGMDFHGEADPTYRDFAYVAFTIGMTYQVSDTELTSRAMRAAVLRHALLSFLFGTAIIAMMINVVAGLLR